MNNDFCHLSVHSIYSPLYGCSTAEQYASAAYDMGHKAISINELGTMASVPDAYFACKSKGIKYVPGCILYYNDYRQKRNEFKTSGGSFYDLQNSNPEYFDRLVNDKHVTAIAKNETGYNNLIELTTLASQNNVGGEYTIDFDDLDKYGDGLVILSGGMVGPIAHELYLDLFHKDIEGTLHPRNEDDKNALQICDMFAGRFGEDFYLELHMPCMPELYDSSIFKLSLAIGKKRGIKTVLTNNCYYMKPDENEIRRAMYAIRQKTNIYDQRLKIDDTDHLYFKSLQQLHDTYLSNGYSNGTDIDFYESCNNTLEIIDKCEDFNPSLLPKIPDWSQVEAGVDADEELLRIVKNELYNRGHMDDETKFIIDGKEVTYYEQAMIECDRFISKGFASYFLVTMDLVRYGKSQSWPFGPRGSAGGSLVCYLLGITSINPMLWGLSFSRFMSESRGGYMLNVKM